MVKELISGAGKVAGSAGLSLALLHAVWLVAALTATVIIVASAVLLSAVFNDQVQQRVTKLISAWRRLPPDPPAASGGPSP